jgi:hypothetical protein
MLQAIGAIILTSLILVILVFGLIYHKHKKNSKSHLIRINLNSNNRPNNYQPTIYDQLNTINNLCTGGRRTNLNNPDVKYYHDDYFIINTKSRPQKKIDSNVNFKNKLAQ